MDADGHNHLPTPAVLKLVGDAFKSAPVSNPDGTTGIRAHFDAGPAYHSIDATAYASTDADEYLVPSILARGGESIVETACMPSATRTCQFPDFPGTVSWKIGFQLYRDAPVAADGAELTPAEEDACEASKAAGTGGCRQRFDSIRRDFFHYVLYAHARGIPKSTDPASPDFHVPRGSSGIADLPGGDAARVARLWDRFVGTDFIQASTTMHELGHNMGRSHGGDPAEPNCKPNYLSVMSYLFQLHGLLDDDGVPHLDYSRPDGQPAR